MSGIRVNEWLHNSGTGGIWQTSAGNVGIASSVPTAKLVVTGDVNVSGALTATNFNGGQLGNRNLVINGAMNVAQRGTSTTTNAAFCVDRFMCLYGSTNEAPTFAQHALTSSDTGPWAKGFRNSLHITNGNQTGGAGASSYVAIDYRFEAQDVASSGWDYTSPASHITISYWVKSSVSQNFYVTLKTDDGTAQNYGFETGTLSADTWTKITKKIPGNSNIQFNNDAGEGLRIRFVAFRGTNMTTSGYTLNTWGAYSSGARMPDNTSTWYTTNDSTFEITGLQVEVGQHATPFEHRRYRDDLVSCYRYCQKYHSGSNTYRFLCQGNVDNDGNNMAMLLNFLEEFRDVPSMTTTGTASDYAARRDTTQTCTSVPVAGSISRQSSQITFIVSSHGWTTGQSVKAFFKTSTSYLIFAAEL